MLLFLFCSITLNVFCQKSQNINLKVKKRINQNIVEVMPDRKDKGYVVFTNKGWGANSIEIRKFNKNLNCTWAKRLIHKDELTYHSLVQEISGNIFLTAISKKQRKLPKDEKINYKAERRHAILYKVGSNGDKIVETDIYGFSHLDGIGFLSNESIVILATDYSTIKASLNYNTDYVTHIYLYDHNLKLRVKKILPFLTVNFSCGDKILHLVSTSTTAISGSDTEYVSRISIDEKLKVLDEKKVLIRKEPFDNPLHLSQLSVRNNGDIIVSFSRANNFIIKKVSGNRIEWTKKIKRQNKFERIEEMKYTDFGIYLLLFSGGSSSKVLKISNNGNLDWEYVAPQNLTIQQLGNINRQYVIVFGFFRKKNRIMGWFGEIDVSK